LKIVFLNADFVYPERTRSFPFAQGKTDYYKCHIAALYSSNNIRIRKKLELALNEFHSRETSSFYRAAFKIKKFEKS